MSPSKASLEVVHRVLRISDADRKAANIKRQQTGYRVKDSLAEAIEVELPLVVSEILAIGFRPTDPKARPARLPLTADLLSDLSAASKATGQDQSALLLCCIRRWSGSLKAAKAAKASKAAKAAKAKPAARRRKAGAR